MVFEALKDLEGGILLLALFIIWKLVEEVIRFRGLKRHRLNRGSNPGCGVCKWTKDDHVWLMDIRDNTKNNKKVMVKLERFLDRELNR